MLRILLTGSTGFLGQRLCASLARDDGLLVTNLGRRAASLTHVRELIVPAFDEISLNKALKSHPFDVLIHLAAAGVHPADRDLRELRQANALLPVRLLEILEAGGLRAAIFAGSSAEYAPSRHQNEVLHEYAALESKSIYGATKAAGGLLAISAAAGMDISAAHLRFFNIYGPGESPHRLLPSLITSLQFRKKVALSRGLQVRDFVHVDDACSAIKKVMRKLIDGKGKTQGIFNVCTGQGHSVREFAESVASNFSSASELLDFGALPMRTDDLPYLVGDPSALSEFCGWRSRIELAEGITQSVNEIVDIKNHE